jgi:hypothetical protein
VARLDVGGHALAADEGGPEEDERVWWSRDVPVGLLARVPGARRPFGWGGNVVIRTI